MRWGNPNCCLLLLMVAAVGEQGLQSAYMMISMAVSMMVEEECRRQWLQWLEMNGVEISVIVMDG